MEAAGSKQTKLHKKARGTPQDHPRAADGQSESGECGSVAGIDLTAEQLCTGESTLTPSWGAGRANPEGAGKVQEEEEQLADPQERLLHIGQATPDHWEDELEESEVDLPRWLRRPSLRSETPNSQDLGEVLVF